MLVSPKAFSQIKYIGYEEARQEIHFPLRKTRDELARHAYLSDKKGDNFNPDDILMIDIIQERFPSDSVLKIVRKKRKLTQEQLAQISGVNIRSIRAYEQDNKNLAKAQSETLQLLAKSLNCSMEELLN